jgi:hypothetical protein
VDDPEPATHARHVDDQARSAREHPWQHGQRQPHRGKEVDPHDILDLVGLQGGDGPPFRDGGIVDQHIDAAERLPGAHRQLAERRGVGQVGDPHCRSWRGSAAVGEHLAEALAPAGDQPHHRLAPGQLPGQGRPQTRRSTRDEHPFARRRVRHQSRLPRIRGSVQ